MFFLRRRQRPCTRSSVMFGQFLLIWPRIGSMLTEFANKVRFYSLFDMTDVRFRYWQNLIILILHDMYSLIPTFTEYVLWIYYYVLICHLFFRVAVLCNIWMAQSLCLYIRCYKLVVFALWYFLWRLICLIFKFKLI